MGPRLTTSEEQQEAFLVQAERYFEPLLIKAGLGKDQIAKQTLPELRQSLQFVNRLIEDPSDFGFIKVSTNANTLVATAKAEAQLGILPIFFERKILILDRIRLLGGEENIEKIVNKVEEHDEAALKQEMIKLSSEMEKLRQQSEEAEQKRQAALLSALAASDEMARRKEAREAFKERWEIWRSFLERESVSTIIGAFLLIIITLSQIIASFTHVTTSQVLDNGFLVILGYFFGQTVAKATAQHRAGDK